MHVDISLYAIVDPIVLDANCIMNDYEARRVEKIKQNQALLAQSDIEPIVIANGTQDSVSRRPAKRRRLAQEAVPSRASARLASALVKPRYHDEPDIRVSALHRPSSNSKGKSSRSGVMSTTSKASDKTDSLIPIDGVESIRAGWSSWEPVGVEPTRDHHGTFRFTDYPDFTPNKSPAEVLREGCFGGSYYRPLRSRKLGIVVEGDWTELPPSWIEGLTVDKYLTSSNYDPEVNKYKAACGQSIEEWEAAGWISHEHDVRGWFQWYTRFFRGRRCEDDGRQVSRWKKCVGETGRWRRMLLKKYVQLGVRQVWDDGEDEDEPQVSPVMHQTCHHWAFEVRQEHLEAYWAS